MISRVEILTYISNCDIILKDSESHLKTKEKMRCVHIMTRIEKFAKFTKQHKTIITKEHIVKNVLIPIRIARIISNYVEHITTIHLRLTNFKIKEKDNVKSTINEKRSNRKN